jgi:23S rRNA pseudouridine2457 synthase
MSEKPKYYAIYKPYGMLTQFTTQLGKKTLKDLDYTFEKDVYPVGRLDEDSEGLLILTNDKTLNNRLLNPKNRHFRSYWVQVEGIPTNEQIAQLAKGVDISVKGVKYHTQPAIAKVIDQPKGLEERSVPIRYRKNIPTSWLEISLIEGKNRQVRKMTAAVGLPTLRLIRYRIEDLVLSNLKIGFVKEMDQKWIFEKLRL